ncbi:alpha-(1,6)-fucosyltransferase [Lampetra fluviatilis]
MRAWPPSWRWIMLILLAWGSLLVYMGGHLIRDPEMGEHSSRELSKIMAKLERLKQQNDDLRQMAEALRVSEQQGEPVVPSSPQRVKGLEERLAQAQMELSFYKEKYQQENAKQASEVGPAVSAVATAARIPAGPGTDHELLRRKVENGIKEFWFFVRSELKKMQHDAGDHPKEKITMMLQDMGHQQRSIMTDLLKLSEADGAAEWRAREAKDLSDLVQQRFHFLQNPKDCRTARKLVCNINKGCGYGCQLHHVVYCFMIAYGTQRTMILESRGWRYSPKGFEKFFQPVSETCRDRSGKSTGHWSGEANDRDVQVVELPIVDSLHPRPPYLPLAVPEDLWERVSRLHGDPSVWWVSQFIKFLVRPQPQLEQEIQQNAEKMGFEHPIVGVHVRRTDKVGTEAAFHAIEEYMSHVEEHFELLARSAPVEVKRVYLATDDPGLLAEAKAKYPSYVFISDNAISRSAGLQNRYSEQSLIGVIMDVHFLAHSDFLVCTFSSQVCRVAYEIMQTLHTDASASFRSLDDIYYFGGQNAHNQAAVYRHEPRSPDEIALEPGDTVGVAGNHWDGYSKGVNRRTGQTGLYPSYKVQERVEVVKYPSYPEADRIRLQKQH